MNSNNRWGALMPPVTKHIIIINVILWVSTILLSERGVVDIEHFLGLHYWQGSDFHFYQLFTYMFMHDSSGFSTGLSHIFFNMFSLWMFGMLLERVMGAKRYLFFYISCGLGAALVQEIVWSLSWQNILASINNVSTDTIKTAIATGDIDGKFLNEFYNHLITVGASGAVFGILLAFGVMFPNMPMYIMFIPIPIKAKWMVIGYGAIELLFGITGTMDNVAHFAHLGGMLFAIIILYYWYKKGIIQKHNNGF